MTITSYNGWTASQRPGDIGITLFTAGGVTFPGGVRSGNTSVVLRYVAEQFHRRVEPLQKALGCWGYAYRQNRNADNLSCHASGTAIDCNAERHPNGKHGTFTAAQITTIRKILAEVDHVVRWGGDFTGTKDEMHFEIVGTPVEVAAVARRLTQPAKSTPTVQEDDMTPEQDARMKNIEQMLKDLTAPRRPDHADTDPGHLSLGDVITADEGQQ